MRRLPRRLNEGIGRLVAVLLVTAGLVAGPVGPSLAGTATGGAAAGATAGPAATGAAAPPAPAGSRTLVVEPGGPLTSIQEALRRARPGDTIVVRGGRYPGPVRIDRPVRLVGEGRPVIDGGGRGTVVHVTAPDVTVQGFHIAGSGRNFNQEDAGITVDAPRATIVGNRVTDTLFGIYLRKAHGSVVQGNVVEGRVEEEVSLRGDSIRVWYSDGVRVENNVVRHGRDILLMFARDVLVQGNEAEASRYALHLMYVEQATVMENTLRGNVVGIYVMYSRDVHLRHNLVTGHRGPGGYGVGLKDADELLVEENQILANRVGVYIDNSPRREDVRNRWVRNAIARNDIGILLLPAVRHNVFAENAFVDNLQGVAVHGGGEPVGNEWSAAGRGNYWSDYAGYDRDGDGIGDVPYRPRSYMLELVDRYPLLRWFMHGPSAAAVEMAVRALPLLAPPPTVEDPFPLTSQPVAMGGATRSPSGSQLGFASAGLLVLAGAGLLAALAPPRVGTGSAVRSTGG
ncbi:MAG: nitrous oxide reductase family maturation protein NosD [Symbiobacteriaceae bacterium]